MAQRTTVMQTSCSDPRSSNKGLDWTGGIITKAIPKITANNTTCSICPSTMEPRGLVGSTVTINWGSASKVGGVTIWPAVATGMVPRARCMVLAST